MAATTDRTPLPADAVNSRVKNTAKATTSIASVAADTRPTALENAVPLAMAAIVVEWATANTSVFFFLKCEHHCCELRQRAKNNPLATCDGKFKFTGAMTYRWISRVRSLSLVVLLFSVSLVRDTVDNVLKVNVNEQRFGNNCHLLLISIVLYK